MSGGSSTGSDNERAQHEDPAPTTDVGLLPHVLGGVAGRVGAESFKSPFDLLKVRLQYDTTLKSRPVPLALLTVLREEGVRAWRGLPPRLLWSAPLAGATFTYYQVLKSETGGGGDEKAGLSLKTILGGPMVLGLSVALRTPFDIIEQQLQLQASAAEKVREAATSGATSPAAAQQQQPAGTAAAASHKPLEPTPRAIASRIHATWTAEGVRGVWRGYSASLLGITSYVSGYFIFYEAARRALEPYSFFERHPTIVHLAAGGFGGGLTAVLATPFDTVKVRMQTRVYASKANPDPSLLHVFRATVRDAGWKGLWRGAAHRAMSNAPSGAIMFAVYGEEAAYAHRPAHPPTHPPTTRLNIAPAVLAVPVDAQRRRTVGSGTSCTRHA
jgi:hypothetical protein